MDRTTRQLAGMVCSLDLGRLPAEAVHEAKRRLLDSIACAAGAFDDPLCAKLRAVAGRYGGTATARIWFTGQPSSVEMAGFANGTMVRYLDLSDTALSRAAGHPSDMIPALVALAESRCASGARLLEGIIAAYELYVGLCDAVAFQKAAVDQSTAAALGAAGGAGRILGLDAEKTGNALALALGTNVNLYNVRRGALSDWKACAGPAAAREGVFAALLAAEGITGPTAVFEGPAGFCDIVGPLRMDLDPFAAPLIARTHLKAHPVCYHGQSAVDAAIRLAGFAHPDEIASVVVETYEAAHRAMGSDPSRWTPGNRETADHSLPYVVGVSLTSGRLTSADYGRERLADPALRDLMSRIEVREVPSFSAAYPAEARSRITITTRDGRIGSAETVQPRGHAQNPLTDGELIGKLDGLWPACFPIGRAEEIAGIVLGLDRVADVTQLVDSLCGCAD